MHCLWLHCLHIGFAPTDQTLGTAVSGSVFISHKYLTGCRHCITQISHPNQQIALCNILPMESCITEKLSNGLIQKVGFSWFLDFCHSLAGWSVHITHFLTRFSVLGCLSLSLKFGMLVHWPKLKASSASELWNPCRHLTKKLLME